MRYVLLANHLHFSVPQMGIAGAENSRIYILPLGEVDRFDVSSFDSFILKWVFSTKLRLDVTNIYYWFFFYITKYI